MNQEAVIADIERRAWEAGVSIRRVCTLAGVHPTTFSRWKKSERNPDPMGANLKSIEQIYLALEALSNSKRRVRRAVSA